MARCRFIEHSLAGKQTTDGDGDSTNETLALVFEPTSNEIQ